MYIILNTLKVPNATHTETVEGVMCRDGLGKKSKFPDHEHMFYLRDYLGRVNSNCQRVQVDENVSSLLRLFL